MPRVTAHRTPHTSWTVAVVAALALVTAAATAEAADMWIFASFSKTNTGETTWTDEAALPTRDRCMELLNTALDSDVGVLPLVGVSVARTQNTVVGTDPRTHRPLLLTIYSCRPESVPERRQPG
jgi:hypothetical protein